MLYETGARIYNKHMPIAENYVKFSGILHDRGFL